MLSKTFNVLVKLRGERRGCKEGQLTAANAAAAERRSLMTSGRRNTVAYVIHEYSI